MPTGRFDVARPYASEVVTVIRIEDLIFCELAGCDKSGRESASRWRDHALARQTLQRFARTVFQTDAFRRLVSHFGQSSLSRMSDDEVMDQIIDLLASDRLHVHVSPFGRGELPQGDELQEAMDEIVRRLDPKLRNIFLTRARAVVPQRDSNLVGAAAAIPIAVAVAVLLLFLIMTGVVLQNSQRKEYKEMAKEWDRRFQLLMQAIHDAPLDIAVQLAKIYTEMKRRGQEIGDSVKAKKDKCLESLDPAKKKQCERVLKILSDALKSLFERLLKRIGPLGGGFSEENLVKGIGSCIEALIEAAKAASDCTGCDMF